MSIKKFAILTQGFSHNLWPFLALAQGLVERNFRVKIFAPKNKKKIIEKSGFDYHELSFEFGSLQSNHEFHEYVRLGKSNDFIKWYRKVIQEVSDTWFKEVSEGIQGMDALVSGHLFDDWVKVMSQHYQIPLFCIIGFRYNQLKLHRVIF